jgi:hypothetical protein
VSEAKERFNLAEQFLEPHGLHEYGTGRASLFLYDFGVAAHEDHSQFGAPEPRHPSQCEPVWLSGWHSDIDQGEIDSSILIQFTKGVDRCGGGNYLMACQGQALGNRRTDGVVIIDNYDCAHERP